MANLNTGGKLNALTEYLSKVLFYLFFFFKENEKPNYSFERLKSFATLNLLSFLERHP